MSDGASSRPLYRIRVEELAERRIREAIERYPRMEVLWEAVKWNLEHDPVRRGQKLGSNPGEEWLVTKCGSWSPGGRPILTLIYRVDGQEVLVAGSRIEWAEPKKKG